MKSPFSSITLNVRLVNYSLALWIHTKYEGGREQHRFVSTSVSPTLYYVNTRMQVDRPVNWLNNVYRLQLTYITVWVCSSSFNEWFNLKKITKFYLFDVNIDQNDLRLGIGSATEADVPPVPAGYLLTPFSCRASSLPSTLRRYMGSIKIWKRGWDITQHTIGYHMARPYMSQTDSNTFHSIKPL